MSWAGKRAGERTVLQVLISGLFAEGIHVSTRRTCRLLVERSGKERAERTREFRMKNQFVQTARGKERVRERDWRVERGRVERERCVLPV